MRRKTPGNGSRIWVPVFLWAQQHYNPVQVTSPRRTLEPRRLLRKGGTSHLPQGLRNKQDRTHQAFSRVAVHSRHSKLEASGRVMNITLRVCPRLRCAHQEGCGDRKPGGKGQPPLPGATCRGKGLNQRRAAAEALPWGSGRALRVDDPAPSACSSVPDSRLHWGS